MGSGVGRSFGFALVSAGATVQGCMGARAKGRAIATRHSSVSSAAMVDRRPFGIDRQGGSWFHWSHAGRRAWHASSHDTEAAMIVSQWTPMARSLDPGGRCSVCGTPMTRQVGGSLCPACLVALALDEGDERGDPALPAGSPRRTRTKSSRCSRGNPAARAISPAVRTSTRSWRSGSFSRPPSRA